MSHILCIILYGVTWLYISIGMPYGSNETNLLSHYDTNSTYIKNILRQAKAAEISSFLNRTADPCANFYRFSCGNWNAINMANSEKGSTGMFERLSDGLDRKIKILLNKADHDKEPPTDKLVKKYYKSCLNLKEIDETIQQNYKSIIEEFGAMPVLHGANWSEASFDWVETVSKIAFKYDIAIIYGVDVAKDFANTTVNAVYIGEPAFALETRRVYLSNYTVLYRDDRKDGIASDLETFLGVEKSLAKETAKEIMDFEIELARGLLKNTDDLTEAEINKLMTLEEMQRLYGPDIDVERLVIGSLGVRVEKVYQYNPQYHENLVQVLRKTSKRVVANYIYYLLVEEFFFEPSETKADKEKECIEATKTEFAKILDNLVFRHYNNNAISNDIKDIWSELKTVFRKQLQTDSSLNWISNQTRSLAVEKLDAMTLQINSYDLKELIVEYSDFNMTDDDFLLNLRRIKGQYALKLRERLNKSAEPFDDGETFSYTPINILQENTIKIPVAFLQPYYLWGPSYPSAIMFGSLGSLIGHEMIHGFDNDGQDYDAEGNLKSWWDEQSMANFVERQNCFKEQYSRYIYSGKRFPKADDQAENIADNGGLRLGYAAYRRWLQTQLEDGKDVNQLETERLPSLDYTNMQLFFISYGQLWCDDVLPKARIYQVASDSHAPSPFRVIGSVSNFDEFAKEFKCQSGTRMNPIHKCTIY